MKKNDEAEVPVTDLTEEGFGIGHTAEGYALFVKGALPGDRVVAHVTKVMKNYGYAIVTDYLERSPDRTAPLCSACGKCGGCTLQELSYEAQLEYKRKRVADALERTGGIRGLSVPLPVHGSPVRYRNKAEIPVCKSRNGEPAAGYYAVHSHRIVPCGDCILSPEEVNRIRDEVIIFMKENGISAYDDPSSEGPGRRNGHSGQRSDRGKGFVRHIVVRRSESTGEILLCMVVNGNKPGKLAGMRLEGVDTLCVNYNTADTNVIFGSRTEVIYGRGYITEHIGDLKYRVYAASFFQVNTRITEKLYEAVKEYVSGIVPSQHEDSVPGKGEMSERRLPTVWDLYCGAGTIGLYVAKAASRVAGIEISPVSVKSAAENARENGITNAEFLQGAAEDRAKELMEITGRPDVIILDPPRKGCDRRLLDTVLDVSPSFLIYVSCNPSTLARDLAVLRTDYEIRDIRLYDMFPNTGHVETVALLSKLSEAKHHIEVKVDMDELDLTSAETKATYKEIQDWVQEMYGFHVTNLNIAQVKQKYGLIERENYNKPKSPNSRQPGCPEEKVKAIEDAMRHFQMI